MRDKRQKIRLRLAFGEESRSEAPTAPGGEIETPTAKRMNESPANNDKQLMEAVCERENCLQALKRVKSNKGGPGIDGMTVDQLSGYLMENGLAGSVEEGSGAVAIPRIANVEMVRRSSAENNMSQMAGRGPQRWRRSDLT